MEIDFKVVMPDGQYFAIKAVLKDGEETLSTDSRHLLDTCGKQLSRTAQLALEGKLPKSEWPKDYLLARMKPEELATLTEKTGVKLVEAP